VIQQTPPDSTGWDTGFISGGKKGGRGGEGYGRRRKGAFWDIHILRGEETCSKETGPAKVKIRLIGPLRKGGKRRRNKSRGWEKESHFRIHTGVFSPPKKSKTNRSLSCVRQVLRFFRLYRFQKGEKGEGEKRRKKGSGKRARLI